jgi:HSP20 family molecular chaperone IbpA
MTFNQFNTLVSDFMLGEWGHESGMNANTAFLKDDVLTMEFEVPGFSNKDIKVSVEDRLLEITDINETNAIAKDGLLTISIPKYEDRKAKLIQVKVK